MKTLVAILLAAGSSVRFGGHKLLQPLPDDDPLGVRSARNLLAAVPKVIAVVRPGDAQLSAAYEKLGLCLVENPEADQGMGSSIVRGVSATLNADGWLIALADMPYIQTATIYQLIEALHHGASLVAPGYEGQRGHPVGFDAGFRSQLMSLKGDQGARSLIERHKEVMRLIPTTDAGVLLDIDEKGDLALN